MKTGIRSSPPAREKLLTAFCMLMENHDFQSVTTKEIAGAAGVSEASIYKYFRNKKGLLYHILDEALIELETEVLNRITPGSTSIDSIRMIIRTCLETCSTNPLFARILFLEVNKFPDFFYSQAYQRLKGYTRTFLEIFKIGVENGEFSAGIDPLSFRNVVFGAISQHCIDHLCFEDKVDPEKIAEAVMGMLVDGVKR